MKYIQLFVTKVNQNKIKKIKISLEEMDPKKIQDHSWWGGWRTSCQKIKKLFCL